jgi:probable HAF family extracellular repeat protein
MSTYRAVTALLVLFACLAARAAAEGTAGASANDPAARLGTRFPAQVPAVTGATPARFAAIGGADAPAGFARLLEGAEAGSGAFLDASLPPVGHQPVRLTTPDGFSIDLVEVGAHGRGRTAGGAVAYEREDGGTSFWRATASGVEEWLLLEGAGAPDVTIWVVRGGTLRQDGETVEVLDGDGAPRMRVAAPRAFLEGGRELSVRLRAAAGVLTAAVERPDDSRGEALLVDPEWGWVPTYPLIQARYHHTAALLPSGEVFVSGGAEKLGGVGHYLRSTEIFDPSGGTWRSGASAPGDLDNTDCVVLPPDAAYPEGRVFVANVTPPDGSWYPARGAIYDPAADSWTPTAILHSSGYTMEKLVVLPDGRVFMAGAWNGSRASVYDPATDVSTDLPSMTYRRTGHTLAFLDDGGDGSDPSTWKVIAFGGRPGPSGDYSNTNTAEYFDFADMQWHLLPLMPEGYWEHNMVRLTHGEHAGKFFIFGGVGGVGTAYYTSTTTLFDPVARTFSTGPSTLHVSQARGGSIAHNGGISTSGFVVYGGGYPQHSNVEILNPYATPMQWARLCSYRPGRISHTTTALLNGTFLIAGGESYLGGPLSNPALVVAPDIVDHDGDLLLGGCDNCPFDSNPGQEDRDGNGVGDVCDVKSIIRGSFYHDQDGSCSVTSGDYRARAGYAWAVAHDAFRGVSYFAPTIQGGAGLPEYAFAVPGGTYTVGAATRGSPPCPPDALTVSVAAGETKSGNDVVVLGVSSPCSDPVFTSAGGPVACGSCANQNPFPCVNAAQQQVHPAPGYPWQITTVFENPGVVGWQSLTFPNPTGRLRITLNSAGTDFVRCLPNTPPTVQWFDGANNPVAAPFTWSFGYPGQGYSLLAPGNVTWTAGYKCQITANYCVPPTATSPYSSWNTMNGPASGTTCTWTAESYLYEDSGAPCDPNDMEVRPAGCGFEGAIEPQELSYRVRFENVGGGAAHDVEIWTYPSAALDLMSLRMIDSSFPVTSVQIEPANAIFPERLVFRLLGIELSPPNPLDPGANKGFIRFALAPREPFDDGVQCVNYADIFFDTEAPVRTNSVLNTLYHGGPVPTVDFAVSRDPGTNPPAYSFVYTGGTLGVSLLWHFGEGATPATSTEASPTGVTYAAPGARAVVLELDRSGCGASKAQVLDVTCEVDLAGPPVALWGVPPDLSTTCGSVPPPAEVLAFDRYCNELEVSVAEVQTPGTGASYSITRTWTCADPATGDPVSGSQTIHVLDQPTLVGVPDDLTVECESMVPPPAPVTGLDDCDPIVSLALDETRTDGASPGAFTLVRTWTLLDSNGNGASGSQTITVLGDSTPPELLGVPFEMEAISLGTLPGGLMSVASAMDDGHVVGWSYGASSYAHAFSWTPGGGMVDLGTLGTDDDRESYASAVSGGQVVGWSYTDDWEQRAFSWTAGGGMVDIGHLGSGFSEARAVDDGMVVGWSYDKYWNQHAFVWTASGGMVDVGHLGSGYSSASSVDDGMVVGWSYDENWNQRAFVWTEERGIVDLGTLGGPESEATDVSDGMVVGWAQTAQGARHAFAWTAQGGMLDLGTLGGFSSRALAVDRGRVVGWAQLPNGRQRAFSWTAAGGMVDLGTLGGDQSQAVAVRGAWVAGWSRTASNATRAFVWTPGAGMVDATPAGWVNSTAVGVDATGHVAGTGRPLGSSDRAFYSSPAPSETTVECESMIPPVPSVTAADSCDPGVTIAYDETRTDETSSPVESYTLLRTWTATDAAGNSASGTQTIHVVLDDKTPPTLAGAPPDTSVECTSIPAAPNLTATDNCDPNPTIRFVEATAGSWSARDFRLERTWTANDASGNSSSHTQRLYLYDKTPPQLSGVPADAVAECGAVPPPADVSAVDACDPSPALTFSEITLPGSGPGESTVVRTWAAADASGNRGVASQVITVHDTQAPELACAADVTVGVDAGGCDAALDIVAPSVADACPTSDAGGAMLRWDFSEDLRVGDDHANPAPDRYGNAGVWSYRYAQVDERDGDYPLMSAFGHMLGHLIDSHQGARFLVGWYVQGQELPFVAKHDTLAPLEMWWGTLPTGKPVVHTGWGESAVIGWTSPINGTVSISGEVTRVDGRFGGIDDPAADGMAWYLDRGATNIVSGLATEWNLPQSLAASPGGEALSAVPVSVGDTFYLVIDPRARPHYDMTRVELTITALSASGGAGGIAWWPGDVETVASETLATDLVGGHAGTLAGGASVVPGLVGDAFAFDGGTASVEIEAGPGSPLNLTGALTLEAWVKPADLGRVAQRVIGKQLDGQYSSSYILGTSSGGVYFGLFSEGNQYYIWGGSQLLPGQWNHIAGTWDGSTMRAYLNGVLQPEEVPFTGPLTIVNDPVRIGRGNTSQYAFAGLIDEPAIYGRALSAVEIQSIFAAGAAGKCRPDGAGPSGCAPILFDGAPAPGGEALAGVRSDDAPLTAPYPKGTTTIQWTATDGAGNSSTCTQTITVVDARPPVLHGVPADASVECGEVPPAPDVTATDGCGDSTVQLSEAMAAGPTPGTFTLTRTWSTVDSSGNTARASQTITVADGAPPTIVCPATVSVPNDAGACGAAVTYSPASASDACSSVDVTYSHASGSTFPLGTTSVIATATDLAGNTASCSFEVTVVDAEAPTITCPPDVLVVSDPGSCSAANVALGTASGADNCEVASIVSHVEHGDDPGCHGEEPGHHGCHFRHWRCARHGHGCRGHDDDRCHICHAHRWHHLGWGCEGEYDSDGGEEEAGGFPIGTTTVVWTAKDAAGNAATCEQTVTVLRSVSVEWRSPLAHQPVRNKIRRGQVVPHKVEVEDCAGHEVTAGVTVKLKVLGIDTDLPGDHVFQDVIEDSAWIGCDGTIANDGVMARIGDGYLFLLDTGNFADPNTYADGSRYYTSTATVYDNATGLVLGSGTVILETRVHGN